MSTKAKAIQTLYRAGRLTKAGVRQAVETNIITENEYFIITGEYFVVPDVPEEPVVPDVPDVPEDEPDEPEEPVAPEDEPDVPVDEPDEEKSETETSEIPPEEIGE